jgi:hypothetical protein
VKRLALAAAALLLAAGCAGVTEEAKFDSVEFGLYAQAWQLAARLEEVCGIEPLEVKIKAHLLVEAERATLYAQFGLYPETKVFAADLSKIAKEFVPGEVKAYCEGTAANLKLQTEIAMKSLGGRAR